ncbi:MAG: hypothetical protein BroJett040_22700 [Oligoflexia bacterium]|nr:MAG: hypothetical protein BroJett040_22700 [Oligoflexia bacterium]
MKTIAIIILFLFTAPLFAIEAISPKTLCDRFLDPQAQKNCENRIEKMNPDSYLAALCALQFDDGKFYECLQISQVKTIDPIALSQCDQGQFNDQERISCLQNLKPELSTKSKRIPASHKKKH